MKYKIVFLGTPIFAVPTLRSLHTNGYPISCVFTQPPKKSNRGQKINKSPIHVAAEDLNVLVRTPSKIELDKDFLKNLNVDLVIVVAYGQIIPKSILELSKNGYINIHASLLPKWRGAAPIQRSILNLEKTTGISIMKLNEKLDEGPVCNSYKIQINDNENSESLSARLAHLSAEKILKKMDEILENKIEFVEQNHQNATYAKKIEKIEGKINWNDDALKIIGKVNGLYPNPGAWFLFKNERYKILKAELLNIDGENGVVLDDELTVGCGQKALKILEIQKQGKNVQKSKEFLLGSLIKRGSILENA